MKSERFRSKKNSVAIPRLAFDEGEGAFVDGLSTSNRILLNKGLKPGTLPALKMNMNITARSRMTAKMTDRMN